MLPLRKKEKLSVTTITRPSSTTKTSKSKLVDVIERKPMTDPSTVRVAFATEASRETTVFYITGIDSSSSVDSVAKALATGKVITFQGAYDDSSDVKLLSVQLTGAPTVEKADNQTTTHLRGYVQGWTSGVRLDESNAAFNPVNNTGRITLPIAW